MPRSSLEPANTRDDTRIDRSKSRALTSIVRISSALAGEESVKYCSSTEESLSRPRAQAQMGAARATLEAPTKRMVMDTTHTGADSSKEERDQRVNDVVARILARSGTALASTTGQDTSQDAGALEREARAGTRRVDTGASDREDISEVE